MPVKKLCAICGSGFVVPPARAISAKTCSLVCKGKLWTKQSLEARPEKPCEICGKMFAFPKSHTGRRHCCSPECANKSRAVSSVRTGVSNHNWKGGTCDHAGGYLYLHVDNHPFAKSHSYVFEHRLVMECWMRDAVPNHHFLVEIDGIKYLPPEIHVHHINENKRDNRPKNLLACTAYSHKLIHNGSAPMRGDVWPEVVGQVSFAPSKIKCICEFCGGEFMKRRCDVARGSGKFCSRSCYNKRPREAFYTQHK